MFPIENRRFFSPETHLQCLDIERRMLTVSHHTITPDEDRLKNIIGQLDISQALNSYAIHGTQGVVGGRLCAHVHLRAASVLRQQRRRQIEQHTISHYPLPDGCPRLTLLPVNRRPPKWQQQLVAAVHHGAVRGRETLWECQVQLPSLERGGGRHDGGDLAVGDQDIGLSAPSRARDWPLAMKHATGWQGD